MNTHAREWLTETPYFPLLPDNCNDWRWLFRKGRSNNQQTKNHGAPRADYPLLQILALRARGWPVRKIAARMGVAFGSINRACAPFGVAPAFVLDSHPNELWAGYVRGEIDIFKKLEYHSKLWWGFRVHTTRSLIARKISSHHRKKFWRKTKNDPYYVKKRKLAAIVAYIGRRARGNSVKRAQFSAHLGCNFDFAIKWIEQQFAPGMSWQTWGADWHIDHVQPLSSFDIMTKNGEMAACHYTNLRPLPASENRKKSAKVLKQLTLFAAA